MMQYVCFVLVAIVSATTNATPANTTADPATSTLTDTVLAQAGGTLPTYTRLSFMTGLVIMLAFVVGPVGMMAYRNRNSIVEFLKNR